MKPPVVSTETNDSVSEVIAERNACRISTAGVFVSTAETVGVVVEAPLTIDVEGGGHFVLLCTPSDERALVAGFLLTEGIIGALRDIRSLRPCASDSSIFRVRLADGAPRPHDAARSLLIVSSCGACGTEGLQAKLSALPRVRDTLRIECGTLNALEQGIRRRQAIFDACGATHAVGIFDREGRILACAEDAGRHNALDKAIGICLMEGSSPAGQCAMLSGRISLEMVAKCARAGIELVAAVSAPTSLALETAERCDITVCGFVREERATIFTHPRRIIGRGARLESAGRCVPKRMGHGPG